MRSVARPLLIPALAAAVALMLAVSLPAALSAEPSVEPCSTGLPAAHGHLDFLKKSTDPATADQIGFGFVTFSTADDAPVAGALHIGFGRTVRIGMVERGSCLLVDERLELTVSFRDVRGDDTTTLIATTTERVEDPGRYEARIVSEDGDPVADGEVVLLGGLIVPD